MWSKRTKRFWNSGSAEAERDRRGRNLRMYTMEILVAALFLILLYRLWDLQIVQGERYAEEFELRITRKVRESNTRGRIYDCNGEILASNKPVFTVTMVDGESYATNRERQLTLNGVIYHVMKRLEKDGESLNQELKIRIGDNGQYEYTVAGTGLTRFLADVFGEANPENLTEAQRETTAEEMVQFLAGEDKFALYEERRGPYTEEELEEYGLPGSYTKAEELALVGVRYQLSLNAYRRYVPVILARGISEETAAYLAENNQSLPGIEVGQDWERVYDGGEAFSHILGYTGKISTEELEKYAGSERDYTADSLVGKAGIEQYFEETLQGIDGERQIQVNNVGKVLGEGEVLREMESGRDIYLSIDKELQIALYHILEQNLAGILVSNLINTKEFDRTRVADASDIRISLYDVYMALIDNYVISLEAFRHPEATALERELGDRLEEKREEVWDSLKRELLEGNTAYGSLSAEMQEYIRYIVNESGILKDISAGEGNAISNDDVWREWKNGGNISPGEFLTHAIESGWIVAGAVESGQQYLTTEEMYLLLVEGMETRISDSIGFEKMLFKWLVREERVTGKEICSLLYDQGVLSASDEDYESLMSGATEPFSFLKMKIEKLEITPAQLALDPCSASAAVIQPGTGKVLALVSYPGYDNNRLANQMDSAYYNKLLNDKSLPLFNRATQQLTAPGSTFKPVTIAAGLMEGVISRDSSVLCDGVFDKVTPSLNCWNHYGHGTVPNAPTALQFSCNDYLCEIAYRLGMLGVTEAVRLTELGEHTGGSGNPESEGDTGGNGNLESEEYAGGNGNEESEKYAGGNGNAESEGHAGGNRNAESEGHAGGNRNAESEGHAGGNGNAESEGHAGGNGNAESEEYAGGSGNLVPVVYEGSRASDNSGVYADNAALGFLQKYAGIFGLDEKSGVEITEAAPHVTDAYGIPSAIGQGTHNYATIQMARYVNTLASDGELFSLSLLKGIAGEDGEISEYETEPVRKVELPDYVWETVRTGMMQFARNNAILKDMELSIAGKTGTAQESELHPDHALFVGYAPAENPQIAVAVRIANGYGSSNATDVGRSIFNYYFGLESPEDIVTGRASRANNTRSD